MINQSDSCSRWVAPERLQESWHPAFFASDYDELDQMLRNGRDAFRLLADFVEIRSIMRSEGVGLPEVVWVVKLGSSGIEMERAFGPSAVQPGYELPAEAILVSRIFKDHLEILYWNEAIAGGKGIGIGEWLILQPKGTAPIGWLAHQLEGRHCRLQIERSLCGAILGRFLTSDVLLRLQINAPSLEDSERLTLETKKVLQARVGHGKSHATFFEAQRAIKPFLLTGATFEERLTQFEDYLLQEHISGVEGGFFVEASTSDHASDLFVVRALRGTMRIDKKPSGFRLKPQENLQIDSAWRSWYWDESPQENVRIFNSLKSGHPLPAHLLMRMLSHAQSRSPLSILDGSILPGFDFFQDIVEAHRQDGRLDVHELCHDLAEQWLRLNSQVYPWPALPGVTPIHPILSESDWFALLENEDFLDLLHAALLVVFRPLVALKVMRNDCVAGVYLLFGRDQLNDPDQVRIMLEGIGVRLQDLLYQTSDFFSQAAKRESLRRLSSVMHQINGPTGRATTALEDLFEFLKSHPEIGAQPVPDEKRARGRAKMNHESLNAHTLEARLGDLAKAIEDIRKVSYQIKRLKWVQSDIPFHKCDLKSILKERLDACGGQLPELKLDLSCENFEIPIQGNREALSAAIDEVINNACRELKEQRVAAPCISAALYRKGDRVVLAIRDNALPDRSALISDPFEEGASLYARSGRGSGLGLAIVRETFHKHGGECRLFENTDEKGRRVSGITFEVLLPFLQE